MLACSSCLHIVRVGALVVVIVAVLLGLLELKLRHDVRLARSYAPALGEVDTVDEYSLSQEEFYTNYVLKRRPVKIRLSNYDHWDTSAILRECGRLKIDFFSPSSWWAIRELQRIWWLRIPFEWMSGLLMGRRTTLRAEVKSRHQRPLKDFLPIDGAGDEASRHGAQNFSMELPLLLQHWLPSQLYGLIEFLKRPVYLHDKPLGKVCPPAFDWFHAPKYLHPNWAFLGFPEEDAELMNDPALFVGERLTTSYPLHQNEAPMDFILVILRGKKRYAIFEPDQHHNLNPMQLEDLSVYRLDPFAPDLVAAPNYSRATGWKGLLEEGDLFFGPAESIHYFENYDSDQQTVALKFWYGTHEAGCEGATRSQCMERFGMTVDPENAAAPSIRSYRHRNMALRERAQRMSRQSQPG